MTCFEVRLNGVAICTAGIADAGVLTAILTHKVVRSSAASAELSDETSLDVSALDARAREHLRWLRGRALTVGDVVAIHVIDAAACDEPTTRVPEDPDEVKRERRRYYEKLKSEFGE